MKKAIVVLAALLVLVGYSIRNRRVLIPHSNVYVHIPLDSTPRLWGNAVEFNHKDWQEICYTPDGKNVKCDALVKASPTSGSEPATVEVKRETPRQIPSQSVQPLRPTIIDARPTKVPTDPKEILAHGCPDGYTIYGTAYGDNIKKKSTLHCVRVKASPKAGQ